MIFNKQYYAEPELNPVEYTRDSGENWFEASITPRIMQGLEPIVGEKNGYFIPSCDTTKPQFSVAIGTLVEDEPLKFRFPENYELAKMYIYGMGNKYTEYTNIENPNYWKISVQNGYKVYTYCKEDSIDLGYLEAGNFYFEIHLTRK